VNPSREIQLRPQDRKEVERILSQFVPNEEVWAYGSRVDGSGHELSDLDLVIRHPADLKIPAGLVLAKLREAFSESNLPFLVDVHDWARLPAEFLATIEAQHIVIQRRGQTHEEALV
jgi:predicted nucleotidyltransferase